MPDEDETMDRAERERFLAALRADEQFRAEVRRDLLGDELLRLPETASPHLADRGLDAMVTDIAHLRRDMKARFTLIEARLERTGAALEDLRRRLAS